MPAKPLSRADRARRLVANLRRRAKTDDAARWLLELLEKGESAHAEPAGDGREKEPSQD